MLWIVELVVRPSPYLALLAVVTTAGPSPFFLLPVIGPHGSFPATAYNLHLGEEPLLPPSHITNQTPPALGHAMNQLPAIWAELGEAGLESGHAYGKALRTVKSCVGSTWCRYGVQDAVSFAVQVENRYKGES